MQMTFATGSSFATAFQKWRHNATSACVIASATAILWELEHYADSKPSVVRIFKSRRFRVTRAPARQVVFKSLQEDLTEKEFESLFRMTRIDFYALLEKLKPRLTKNVEMGARGGHPTVLPDARLAITLRMLAGAQYGDLMLIFRIRQSTAYTVFHDTVDAINAKICLPLLPDSDARLKKLSDGMKLSRFRGNPLTGCIGAIDGICIKIRKPRGELNPALFYCRKGYYAIPVQALVDHSYRSLCASANCAGSTHDSLALSSSKLGMYLAKGLLGKPYWIAGDEAYVCTESLLTPYPASQLEGFTFRKSFNFFLSSMRMHVEQAFGLLKAKWRILDDLNFEVEVCSRVILLTMKLHNYCLEQGSETWRKHKRSIFETNRLREEAAQWYEISKQDEFDRVDTLGRCDTFGYSEEATFANAASLKREHLVAYLEVIGITRPGE